MSEQPEKRKPTPRMIAKNALFACGVILWAVIAFFGAQLLLGIVLNTGQVSGWWDVSQMDVTVYNAMIFALVFGLTIAIAVGVPRLLRLSMTTLSDIGLQRLPTWSELGLAPIAYIVSLFVTATVLYVIAQIIPGFDINQEQYVGFSGLTLRYEYIIAFIALVVVAPVAEEILFRGYLYGKLKRLIPTWTAIILVSALFGLAHGQWNVGITTFILSIFLCLLRDFTGSLWPAIFLHMTRNAIAYIGLYILM